jgi:EpsI family protein
MRNQVQHLVPAAALAAGCLMVFGMREQQRVQPRAAMNSIALEAPGYPRVKDIPIDTIEQRIAGMDQFLNRSFQKDSLDLGFSVYVGYYTYQQQGKAIHSPKNCLPGAGWEPLESAPRVVRVGDRDVTVNRYLLANKGAQALVYYWYQGRGRIEHDEYRVKWHLLRDAALYGRTEEALVRIVVPIDPRTLQGGQAKAVYAAADAQADGLARQLVPQVERVIPPAPGT